MVTGELGAFPRASLSHLPTPLEEAPRLTDRLAGAAAELLGVSAPLMDDVRFDDVCLGDGYGIPNDAVWRAIDPFGRTTGLALDPVYSGKAAAAMLDWISSERIAADEHVVFVHTGGMPGLFGYAPDAIVNVA